MRVVAKKIFEIEEQKGKHMLKVKAELFKAKQEGTIFFYEDIFSLSFDEKEYISLYYSEFASPNSDHNAFPVPKEEYILPKSEKERYEFFKKYYELYYPDSEMDYNLFLSFNPKPFEAKKCVWFFRKEDQ